MFAKFSSFNLLRPRRESIADKHKLVFVGQSRNASTELRGRQLALMAAEAPEFSGCHVEFVDTTDFSDSIAVLTKGFLLRADRHLLRAMRRRDNKLIGDFLDRQPKAKLVRQLDGVLASSIRQRVFFEQAFPRTQCHLVTHHVDIRIADMTPAADRLRIGYFGELCNARYRNELAGEIEFIETNTTNPDPSASWILRLQNYNTHYLVREKHDFDHFKPFTKGFIAARCHAPIIVDREEGDASFYLPSDYPYFVEDPANVKNIRDVISRMHSDFPERAARWRRSLEIMESIRLRSSCEIVVKELAAAMASHGLKCSAPSAPRADQQVS